MDPTPSSAEPEPPAGAAPEIAQPSEDRLPAPQASSADDSLADVAAVETTGGEEAQAPSSPAGESAATGDPLSVLVERASRGRLSPADEEEAIKLVQAALADGREGLARAVEQLPQLPWIIGVNGVTAAWPEMKPAVRNRLLASLARVDTDAARRVRLSLARGLFKLEPAVAAKLAVGVSKEIWDKETGEIPPKIAQVFANVLIGRAKPWIAQLPLGDLKPPEAELLVHCALYTVFLLPHTPVTQLGVLKWAAAAGKLGKLHKSVLELMTKGLNRWSGKWQSVLRREVEGLPEEILSILKPEQPAPIDNRRGGRERERPSPADPSTRPESSEEGEPDPEEAATQTRGEQDGAEDTDADADDQAALPLDAAAARPRPVYESKTVPSRERERERDPRDRERKPGGNFNLHETLRQIDSYVASLRSELSTAQGKLRQREDDSRKIRKPDRGAAPLIPGEPSPEELARLNVQLEARNLELTHQIEELRGDSEDRAAAMEIATGQPTEDEDKRLRQLLTLKLQESYDDFLALESESPDIVAPKHYRTVLGHVFQVLAAESIFTAAPPVD